MFWRILGNGLLLPGGAAAADSLTHLARESVGSDTTSVTFSSLTLADRAAFLLTFDMVVGSAYNMQVTFNGNSTTTDYSEQLIQSRGHLTTPNRLNSNAIWRTNSLQHIFAVAWVGLAGDHAICHSAAQQGASTSNNEMDSHSVFDPTNTYTNITSITLTSSVASKIITGSVIDLFALDIET